MEIKEILQKIDSGNVTDEEIKSVASELLSYIEKEGLNIDELSAQYGTEQGKVLRLLALICSRDEYRTTKGCEAFDEYIKNPVSKKKKVKKEKSKEEEEEADEEKITQRLGPDYMEKEFATGGLNFDEMGRGFILARGTVFHPAIVYLYDILKRTYITIVDEKGNKVRISLLNFTINEDPNKQIGFFSWINNVIIRYYESMGIKPIVLLTDYKDLVSASLSAQGMKIESLPDYLKPGSIYVKVRGSRTGHQKVAVENALEGENIE